MTTHGKWSQPDVPHKGWTCIDVTDLEEPSDTCEMCEVQEIRYVHHMNHPDWSEVLGVGCVCAEKMEQGYDGKAAERELVRRAGRRRRWLSRAWRPTRRGGEWLVDEGCRFAVCRFGDGFHAFLDGVGGRKLFPTADAAKLALFNFQWPKKLPRT
jgi:hypothetical protein